MMHYTLTVGEDGSVELPPELAAVLGDSVVFSVDEEGVIHLYNAVEYRAPAVPTPTLFPIMLIAATLARCSDAR